eukprot:8678872-Lingulodinium_polyedra.AAC.1
MTLTDDGIEFEADPALIEEAISAMNLGSANPTTTPATRAEFFGNGSSESLREKRCRPDLAQGGEEGNSGWGQVGQLRTDQYDCDDD